MHTELVNLLPRLRRFALALTGNRTDADDLVQDAIEKALRRADQWREGSRFDSWVFRIAQNTWIDRVRSRRSRGRHVVEDPDADAPGVDGRDAMHASLTLDRALKVLAAMPEELRAVITLIHVEGFTYREAAEILDVPEGTVTSRLYRARAMIESKVLGEVETP